MASRKRSSFHSSPHADLFGWTGRFCTRKSPGRAQNRRRKSSAKSGMDVLDKDRASICPAFQSRPQDGLQGGADTFSLRSGERTKALRRNGSLHFVVWTADCSVTGSTIELPETIHVSRHRDSGEIVRRRAGQ